MTGHAFGETAGGVGERVGPGGFVLLAGLTVTDERNREAVGLAGVFERPPALVAGPLLVDLGVVTGEATKHPATAVVVALGTTGGAVLARTRRTHQVERAGLEP